MIKSVKCSPTKFVYSVKQVFITAVEVWEIVRKSMNVKVNNEVSVIDVHGSRYWIIDTDRSITLPRMIQILKKKLISITSSATIEDYNVCAQRPTNDNKWDSSHLTKLLMHKDTAS